MCSRVDWNFRYVDWESSIWLGVLMIGVEGWVSWGFFFVSLFGLLDLYGVVLIGARGGMYLSFLAWRLRLIDSTDET